MAIAGPLRLAPPSPGRASGPAQTVKTVRGVFQRNLLLTFYEGNAGEGVESLGRAQNRIPPGAIARSGPACRSSSASLPSLPSVNRRYGVFIYRDLPVTRLVLTEGNEEPRARPTPAAVRPTRWRPAVPSRPGTNPLPDQGLSAFSRNLSCARVAPADQFCFAIPAATS